MFESGPRSKRLHQCLSTPPTFQRYFTNGLILSNITRCAVIVDFDIDEGPASLAKVCNHLFGFRLCHSSHETIMKCLFWYLNHEQPVQQDAVSGSLALL